MKYNISDISSYILHGLVFIEREHLLLYIFYLLCKFCSNPFLRPIRTKQWWKENALSVWFVSFMWLENYCA